jgi:hypothetical protein
MANGGMAMEMAAAGGSRHVQPIQSSIVVGVEWNYGWASMQIQVIGHGQARSACGWAISRKAFGIADAPDQFDQVQGRVPR